MRFAHILARLTGAPWFITEEALMRITDILEARINAGSDTFVPLPGNPIESDDDELIAPGVGIVTIDGVLGNHLSMIERSCGGCDYGSIVGGVRQYANDPLVRTILLHFKNSPGGTASGCPEAFRALREIREECGKPMLALVTGQASSAAFYLASACQKIFATPSSMVGSIGVVQKVEDRSEANAKAGIKRFAITSAEMKDIGNPDRPMTDAERSVLQHMAEHIGAMFKRDVASCRPQILPEVFSKGLPYYASDALTLGLIDGVATNFEDFVASLVAGRQVAGDTTASGAPTSTNATAQLFGLAQVRADCERQLAARTARDVKFRHAQNQSSAATRLTGIDRVRADLERQLAARAERDAHCRLAQNQQSGRSGLTGLDRVRADFERQASLRRIAKK